MRRRVLNNELFYVVSSLSNLTFAVEPAAKAA